MREALEDIAGFLGLTARRGHQTSPFEVIDRILKGLPVAALDAVAGVVAPDETNFKYLIVPRATLARRRRQHDERLSAEESERLARLAKLWVLARDVWGDDESARAFLFRPHMMLEARRPIDVALGTDLGARLVEDILGRLQYGSAA
jgi:putative toxin-antitoxin system antitoxin component (TIGR02293 family)